MDQDIPQTEPARNAEVASREKVSRELRLAIALLAIWSCANIFLYWNQHAMDLSGLYFASVFYQWGDAVHVYSDITDRFIWLEAPDAWASLSAARDYPKQVLSDYVYPPLWVALFGPLAEPISPYHFFNLARIANMALFSVGILAAWDMAGRPVSALLWAAIAVALVELTSFGFLALDLSQPQFLVVGLLIIAFALYHRGAVVAGGVLLALVAAIKLTPAAFVIIFIADRNWRALAAFTLAGAALAGLSVLLAGWPLHQDFLGRLDVVSDVALFSHINASLSALANLVAEDAYAVLGHAWVEYQPAARAVATVMTLAGVAAAYAIRRRNPDGAGLALTIAFLGMATVIGSPLGWLHYLILLAALAPVLYTRLSHRGATLAIAAFGLVFNETLFWQFLEWPIHYSMIYNTIAATLVTLAILTLALTRPSSPRKP